MILPLVLLAVPVAPDAPPPQWDVVAPIIQKHCTSCHVDGGPAPFPFVTHQDMARRRSFVAKVLREELMPPWLPGDSGLPVHGDRSMPDAERAMLIRWLEAGAPAGPTPPAIEPTPAVPLPDDTITLKMSDTFTIPPETEDNGHQYHQDTWSFVLPICSTDEIRLRGMQWDSSAPENLHTATILLDGRKRHRQ